MRRLWLDGLFIILVILLGLTGCKKEEETTAPPPPGGETNFSIVAIVHEDGATVFLWDSLGNTIDNATVVINNDTLPLFFDIYYDTLVRFANGATYSLHVDAGTYGTLDAQVTAPSIDSLKISFPTPNTQLPMGSPVTVTWNYYGGTNDKDITVMFAYTDTTTYYTWPALPGSSTSHTIPGSALYKNGDALITVYAGEFLSFEDLLPPPSPDYGFVSLFAVITSDQVNVVVGGR